DAVAGDDARAGREVGGGDPRHEVVEVGVGLGQQVQAGVDDLAEVVRRDVGGHPHGDAAGPVDQQVGEARRQHDRFGLVAVVVGDEVDGVLVDAGEQLHRDRRQARLGVAHSGGAVAV